MDELKMLVEMVANMPTLAVWVLVGFLAYKVAVVGSIYGLARFLIDKLHDWAVTKKTTQHVRFTREEMAVIDDKTVLELKTQIQRLRKSHLSYIHMDDVDQLRVAIDKMQAEAKK